MAETRAKLTSEERRFLSRIVDYDGAAQADELPPANREQDRARRRCKRDGLAVFDRPYWRITELAEWVEAGCPL